MGRLVGERGLTLVELLVALVMGLVLLAGVAVIFLANKESYRMQDSLAGLQENARFAIGLLERDLSQAGYAGCATKVLFEPGGESAGPNVAGPIVKTAGGAVPRKFADYGQAVDGLAAGDSNIAVQLAGLNPSAVGASDVLFVRAPIGREDRVQGQSGTTLTLSGTNTYAARDVVLVTDCEGGYIVQLPAGTPNPASLDLGVALAREFPEGARRSEVQVVRNGAYYIAPSASVAAVRALWRWDGVHPAQELAVGVEQLWVDFGVDTTGDSVVDTYLDAAEVNMEAAKSGAPVRDYWNTRVLTVRVVLLLASPNVVIDSGQRASASQTVLAALDAIDAGLKDRLEDEDRLRDGRLRHVATSTVALRNRVTP